MTSKTPAKTWLAFLLSFPVPLEVKSSLTMGQYDAVLGPLLLSAFVNTYVCGLVGFHVGTYIGTPFRDPIYVKSIVAALFTLDLAQTIIIIYAIWKRCVENYAAPSIMAIASPWTYTSIPIFIAASSLISHVFLASQIYESTKNVAVRRLVEVLSLLSFALAIATGVVGLQKNLSSFDIVGRTSATYRIVLICWIAVQFAADLSICATFNFHYAKAGTLSNLLTEPSSAFDLFMRTNSIGALFSLLALLFVVGMPRSLAYIVVLLPLGRLYSAAVVRQLLIRTSSTDAERPLAGANVHWAGSNLFSLALPNQDKPGADADADPSSDTPLRNLKGKPKLHHHVKSNPSARLKCKPSLSLVHVKTEQSVVTDPDPVQRRSNSVTQSRRTSINGDDVGLPSSSASVGSGSGSANGRSDEDLRDFQPALPRSQRPMTEEERKILRIADGSNFNKKRISTFPVAQR